jgi:hypothetical protein
MVVPNCDRVATDAGIPRDLSVGGFGRLSQQEWSDLFDRLREA